MEILRINWYFFEKKNSRFSTTAAGSTIQAGFLIKILSTKSIPQDKADCDIALSTFSLLVVLFYYDGFVRAEQFIFYASPSHSSSEC